MYSIIIVLGLVKVNIFQFVHGNRLSSLTDKELYFASYQISTVISLFNESLFYHIEEDLYEPGCLLACLGNAVIKIYPTKYQHSSAYVGISNLEGYIEDTGLMARFREVVSLVQLNSSTLLVSDANNYCIRQVDRNSNETSPAVGNCTEQVKREQVWAGTSANDIRFLQPGALVFDALQNRLYISDNKYIRVLDLTTNIFAEGVRIQHVIRGLSASINGSRLFAAFDHGVMTLSNDGQLQTFIGSATGGNVDGNLSDSLFREPKLLMELTKDKYLLTDYRNNKIRVVDTATSRTYSLCSGDHGHINGNLKSCQLLMPYSLVVIGEKVYIGERGTYGGGLRVLYPISSSGEMSKVFYGTGVIAAVAALLAVAICTVAAARYYTAKLDKEDRENQNKANLKGRLSTMFEKQEANITLAEYLNRLSDGTVVSQSTVNINKYRSQSNVMLDRLNRDDTSEESQGNLSSYHNDKQEVNVHRSDRHKLKK